MNRYAARHRLLLETVNGITHEAHFGILEFHGGIYASTPALLVRANSNENEDTLKMHILEKPAVIADSVPIYCVVTKNTKTGALSREEYGIAIAPEPDPEPDTESESAPAPIDVTNNDQVIRFMAQKIWGVSPKDIKQYNLVPLK